MKKNTELINLKPKIVSILKSRGIKKAGIFGSYVRGENKKNSDIDILIQPTKYMSLLGFVETKLELEYELGINVDLISYNGIHPFIRKQILREEVKII